MYEYSKKNSKGINKYTVINKLFLHPRHRDNQLPTHEEATLKINEFLERCFRDSSQTEVNKNGNVPYTLFSILLFSLKIYFVYHFISVATDPYHSF